LTVVVPAALFARGLTSKTSTMNAGTAVFAFLLWEMVKIGLTIAMLYVAVRWVKDLSWPAMLVGLVVTMKVYWVVFAWRKFFHPVG
jgi:ATP synthase protein I